jgi:hypothetical protein
VTESISARDLRRIAETAGEPCISLYLPTHPSGPDAAQDHLRLSNLSNQASRELDAWGLDGPKEAELLAPARRLVQDIEFWTHSTNGLAVLVASHETTTVRLPDPVDELVVVSERFHVKPLIRFLASDKSFHVLALSQGDIRLLHASRLEVSEVDLGETPRTLAEALAFDDRERQLQSHAADQIGRGRVGAAFHGQGIGKDTRKPDLERFLRMVDHGIHRLIGDSSVLVLAGVERIVAAYAGLTTQRRIVPEVIQGNPEHLSAVDLHRRSLPLVEESFAEGRRRASSSFLGGAVPTLDQVTEVVRAAQLGRVASLFVPDGTQAWGALGDEAVTEHRERHQGDRDLFDMAAVDTLLRGGQVFVVPESDIPGGGPLAAVLRF